MAPRTRTQSTPVSSLEADALQRALHALGEYAHVAVRAERGHLNLFIDDGAPVARVTPLGANQYGLSFHSHTGRWDKSRSSVSSSRWLTISSRPLAPTSSAPIFPAAFARRGTRLGVSPIRGKLDKSIELTSRGSSASSPAVHSRL